MLKKILFVSIFNISILYANNIDIKGQDDNMVVLKETAKRALIFTMPFASMYIAIDNGTKNIVGVHGSSNKNLKTSFMINAYPDIKNLNTELVQSGFTPNIEQVLALKPDVVFQWADQGDHIIEPLRKLGLHVISVKYGTQEYLEEWIKIMGQTTGNNDKAMQILKWHEEKKSLLNSLTSKNKTKPKIVSLQTSKDRIKIAGNGSYDNYTIELAGGINPAKNDIQRFADISKEQLLKYNPDIIILGTFDSHTPDDFMSQEIFKNLKAVKNKQVYKLPVGGYRWGVPHVEIPLTWLWLYQLIDGSESIHLKKEMKHAYKSLYNYDISDEEIKQILSLDINKNTKNYTKLLD